MVQRIKQVVLDGLDRRRFPWVTAGREPTESERQASVIASAALIATRRLETRRRGDGKREQESAVHAALRTLGFEQLASRKVARLKTAPWPGQFLPASNLRNPQPDRMV